MVSPMMAVCLWLPLQFSYPGSSWALHNLLASQSTLLHEYHTRLPYRVTVKGWSLYGGTSVGITKTVHLHSMLFKKMRTAFSSDMLKILGLFSSTFSLQNSTNRAVLKRGSQCLSNFRFMYWASLGFSFLMCYLGCQLKKTLAPLPACQLGHMCPADLFQKH